jgi:8-oxo-dGTP pyrophosphatase MutT (NUDIX family)
MTADATGSVVERRAARVIVIADDAVLLICGRDPARPELGSWWLTPGGGIEDEETLEAAAVRELREETGFELAPDALGPCIATRTAEFEFDGVAYRQREWFFAARVERFTPHDGGWEPVEQRALLGHRWWTLAELDATTDLVYPAELATVVRAVRAGPVDPPFVLTGT